MNFIGMHFTISEIVTNFLNNVFYSYTIFTD